MKSSRYALLLILILSVFTHIASWASPAPEGKPGCTLVLHVSDVRNTHGVVRYAIFSTEQGWPDDKSKSIRYGTMPANGGTVTFNVTGLSPGSYGISVLHDENENHKLDSDILGRPKEGIGFGNNPKIRFSTPSWKQSSVQVDGASVETTVHLRYP